jgi:hypothetical protein
VLELFWLFENCIGENLCRPGLEPGPITTNAYYCVVLGPQSHSQLRLVVMGPGVRRDECVREDALTERCESVPELVATP